MIADGYAHEYTYYVPYRYQQEFKAAQSDARAHERGLWSPNACAA
jgi:micrococcal nuclease